jgi:hypothetical protein
LLKHQVALKRKRKDIAWIKRRLKK